jgi:hypothetical protein
MRCHKECKNEMNEYPIVFTSVRNERRGFCYLSGIELIPKKNRHETI